MKSITIKGIAEAIAFKLGNPLDYMLTTTLEVEVVGALATLIDRESKGGMFNHGLLITISCIPLDVVCANECGGNSEDKVLRSRHKMPTPINLKYNGLMFYNISNGVISKDKYVSIPLISINQLAYNKTKKFTKNSVKALYINNYIYILNNITLKTISVTALFANPMEVPVFVEECNSCDCCTTTKTTLTCFQDGDYIVPNNYVNDIIAIVQGRRTAVADTKDAQIDE
jgi:hypothetical protein